MGLSFSLSETKTYSLRRFLDGISHSVMNLCTKNHVTQISLSVASKILSLELQDSDLDWSMLAAKCILGNGDRVPCLEELTD